MTTWTRAQTTALFRPSADRLAFAAALAMALAALALRVYRLDFFALRGDESFTVQFSSLPADALFEGTRSVEPNPPLYYYALRGWIAVAGQSEYAVRFFSAFFGVLCVPLMYALGRSLGDRSGWSPRLLGPSIRFRSSTVRMCAITRCGRH